MRRHSQSGFTFAELLIYTALFGLAAVFLTSVLTTAVRIQQKEAAKVEVGQQVNLVLATIQRLIRESSLVECVDTSCALTQGSYLKVRFEDNARDPTCVSYDNVAKVIRIAEGPNGVNPELCTATTVDLTSPTVTVDSLTFTKNEIVGGHTTVQVDAVLTYNSSNPDVAISRTLKSAIGRASAATFDTNVIPSSATSTLSIGDASNKWEQIYVGRLIHLGTSAGGIESPPPQTGSLYYDTTAGDERLRARTTGGLWRDVSPWKVSGSNVYFNAGLIGIGTASPSEGVTLGNGTGLARNILLTKENTATSGVQYPSNDLILQASSWNTSLASESANNYVIRNVGESGVGAVYRLGFLNASSTEVFTIKENGRVGIGATNPGAQLHVTGGDIYTSNAGSGLIAKSPDGLTCKRIGIDNGGTITAATTTCP